MRAASRAVLGLVVLGLLSSWSLAAEADQLVPAKAPAKPPESASVPDAQPAVERAESADAAGAVAESVEAAVAVPDWEQLLEESTATIAALREENTRLERALTAALDEQVRWQRIMQDEEAIRAGRVLREQLVDRWDPALAWSLVDVALLEGHDEQWPESERLARWALAIIEQAWGRDHVARGTVLQHVGHACQRQGLWENANYAYEEALRVFAATVGEAHPRYAAALNAWGTALAAQEKYGEAERAYRQAIDIYRDQHDGVLKADAAVPLHNLGLLLQAQQRFDEARTSLSRAARAQQRRPAASLQQQALVQRSLARLYAAVNDFDEAVTHQQQADALESRATALR